MFNLEQSIAEWRRQMHADGLKSRGVLDELESHVREEVERRVQAGWGAQPAFEVAIQQLGQTDVLTNEFAKVGETDEAFARVKHFFLTLAGIQNPILATNMNTSSSNANLEPVWATYLKSAAFVLPAAFLWLFVAVFVFPKFNEVVSQSGIRAAMPGFLRSGWDLALFLTHYLFDLCVVLALAIALLEWRSDRWPRYRRAAFGVGVFLLNSAVLIAITAMVVLALVAAPALAHHAK